jgi:Spy/CpxP family protein refolding chaperone
MKAITRNKWFLFLLGFLLLCNIALLLSFFVFGEKGQSAEKNTHQANSEFLYRTLGLNQEQEKQFREMKEAHFAMMKPVWEKTKMTKDSLFRLLKDPAISDSVVQSITDRIAALNQESDIKLFHHFQALRNICTPQQQQTFDTLIPQLMTRQWNRGRGGRK